MTLSKRDLIAEQAHNGLRAAVWSTAKVPHDLISDGRNRYSVLSNLIGENVDIRRKRNIVEVFYHGAQVALESCIGCGRRGLMECLADLEHPDCD